MEYLQARAFQPPPPVRSSHPNSQDFTSHNMALPPPPPLPQSSYNPAAFRQPPLHDKPQKKFVRYMPPAALEMPLPPRRSSLATYEEGGETPTPRAHPVPPAALVSPGPMSSISQQARRESQASYGFEENDSSYESSDSEIVSIHISNSIKKVLRSPRTPRTPKTPKGFPQLSIVSPAIPSPSGWPTIQKLQRSQHKADKSGMRPMSVPRTPLSPAALAKLSLAPVPVPTKSETPSLDGSLTSEDVASLSCPSTPHTQTTTDEAWEMPTQLHPDALSTLMSLSNDFSVASESVQEASLSMQSAAPAEPPREMQSRGLEIGIAIPMPPPSSSSEEFEPLSAISIPSPGGFFSSLDHGAQSMWASVRQEPAGPTTSVAETFYGVPWDRRPSYPRVHSVDNTASQADEGPPTARRDTFFPAEEVDEMVPVNVKGEHEYEADYEKKLSSDATCNLNRTSLWITAQENYLSALTDTNPVNEPMTDSAIVQSPVSYCSTEAPAKASFVSPKKSVRFAKAPGLQKVREDDGVVDSESPSVAANSLFYHAFQHMVKKSSAGDAYLHRHARSEAIQTQRSYLSAAHRAQLTGKLSISNSAASPAASQASSKPKAARGQDGPDDQQAEKQREAISNADKERQAVQQLSLAVWNIEACKLMWGGALLPKPASELIASITRAGRRPARILDLGGQPTADWGWAVAVEHSGASVFTAITSNETDWMAHRGPSNHRTVKVPNAWTLPFPDSTFDVVSARTLHTLLHSSSASSSASSSSGPGARSSTAAAPSPAPAALTRDGGDEYDATLAEIKRVLAPGGKLHFSLLDAEVAAPASSALAARGIEFAVALRARGYDACATRHFLPRLGRAGFAAVQRTWIDLSLGTGRRDDSIEPVAGLVAALAWEKWMLKLQTEAGRPDDRLLEGVARALSEARRHAAEEAGAGSTTSTAAAASWKMLIGCATKS